MGFLKTHLSGTSLVFWQNLPSLRFHASIAGAWVSFLVRELGSCMLWQKKKKINKNTFFSVCHKRYDSHAKILVALLIQIPGGPLGLPKEYDLDVTYGPD